MTNVPTTMLPTARRSCAAPRRQLSIRLRAACRAAVQRLKDRVGVDDLLLAVPVAWVPDSRLSDSAERALFHRVTRRHQHVR